jgi:hypothetical protein
MCLGRVGSKVATASVMVLLVCGAYGQYRPEVPVLKCMHQGEPVPEVPGATFVGFYAPKIDAAGNVLVSAWMTGPGIDWSNNEGLWYGQPGALTLVARDGWPAPGLFGVYYSGVTAAACECVSETGWIVFTSYLTGVGVTPDVNDRAVFCGPPGDFHLVKRTGAAVPEVGPDVTIDGAGWIFAWISDNGTLGVQAELAGASLPPTELHRVWWVGPRGGLQLAVWDGMPIPDCPECEPGVYLYGAGHLVFNDAGQVAFYGAVQGPGVHWYDNDARFIGAAGALTMMERGWDLMPQFGPGARILDVSGGLYAFNRFGDNVNRIKLYGTGVTTANDWALIGGEPEPVIAIAREGDPTPEAGEGVYIASVSAPFINDQRQVLYRVTFAGPGIDESNRYGDYLGTYTDPRLILRDGQIAAYFLAGTKLHVAFVEGSVAMNDVGDFAAVTTVENPASGTIEVMGLWRGLTAHYVPLLQTGDQVFGRTVIVTDSCEVYSMLTGGADSLPQSFNDRRQLATLLDFTDGTTGIYRIGPPLLGDTDGDGQVGVAELMAFAGCAAGPGAGVAPGCDALDLNLDGSVDARDLSLLQAMLGEAR